MPALLARMSMSAFLGNGRGPFQFGIDRTVRFREGLDDFLRDIFGNDLGRVGFSIGVFKNESRFRGFEGLAVGRSRKEQAAGRNRYETGGAGAGIWHKERDLSRIIPACETGF